MADETKSEAPWIGTGGEGWRRVLMGNRAGLEILRDGIERALACDADAALIEQRRYSIERIQIIAKDPRPKSQPRKGRDWKSEIKEAFWLLLSAVAAFIFLSLAFTVAIFLWHILRRHFFG